MLHIILMDGVVIWHVLLKKFFPDKIVMTSGDIHNPQSACEILENQDTDLIGMGRQTIANPSWSHKVKNRKNR